jgi:tRNA pseudouridine32 synthase/23S rRNA pseudouridine746 synthase
MNLEIVYQDEYLLAVNKPEGLLSVPGLGEANQDCVVSRLLENHPEVKVVHRLDCYTSGIMLLAVGIEAQRNLSRQFHDRKIHKEYIAVVHGVLSEQQGIIDIPMRGDPDDRPRQIVDYQQGKNSTTQWTVINVENNRTRLLLKPVTGRTHQLRVHCKAIGHTIVGDGLYGDATDEAEKRMLLHAESIELFHPLTGEHMKLKVPCDF